MPVLSSADELQKVATEVNPDVNSEQNDGVTDSAETNSHGVASQVLTSQTLPYAFARRHGVLIGQIEDDSIDLLHFSPPSPRTPETPLRRVWTGVIDPSMPYRITCSASSSGLTT